MLEQDGDTTFTLNMLSKNILLLVIALSFIGSSMFVVKFGPIHLFPFRIALLLFIGFVLGALVIKRGNFKFAMGVGHYLLFLIFWVVYALFSLFWALSAADALTNIIHLMCAVSVIIFVVIFLSTIDELKKFNSVWLVMLAISLIVGLWNYKTGSQLSSSNLFNAPAYRRHIPTSFYHNQNDFATYLALSIPFLISYIKYKISFFKRASGVALLALALLIMLVISSRANLIALLIGLIFWFIFLLDIREKYKALALSFVAVIFVLLVYPESLAGIMQNAISGLKFFVAEAKDSSTLVRLNLIKNSLLFLINSYGFGVGAGNAEYYMANFAQFYVGRLTNVHNWWVEIVTNYGLIIFSGYVMFYLSLCWNLYLTFLKTVQKEERAICEALLVGLVIFIFGSFSPSSVIAFIPQWLLIAFALAFLNYFRTKRTRPEEKGCRR